MKRKDERYNIKTDARYNYWLLLENNTKATVMQPPKESVLNEIIRVSK